MREPWSEGWGRDTINPWTALNNTWDLAHNAAQSRAFLWSSAG